jgi:hypothetical protein
VTDAVTGHLLVNSRFFAVADNDFSELDLKIGDDRSRNPVAPKISDSANFVWARL